MSASSKKIPYINVSTKFVASKNNSSRKTPSSSSGVKNNEYVFATLYSLPSHTYRSNPSSSNTTHNNSATSHSSPSHSSPSHLYPSHSSLSHSSPSHSYPSYSSPSHSSPSHSSSSHSSLSDMSPSHMYSSHMYSSHISPNNSSLSDYPAYNGYQHQPRQIRSTQRSVPPVEGIAVNLQKLECHPLEYASGMPFTEGITRRNNKSPQSQILPALQLLPVLEKKEQMASNVVMRAVTEKNVGNRREFFNSFNTAPVSDEYEEDDNQTPVKMMASSDVRKTVNNTSSVPKGIINDKLTSKASFPKKSKKKSKQYRLPQETKVIPNDTCESTSIVKSMENRQEISDPLNPRVLREKYGIYKDQSRVNKMVRSDILMHVNNTSSKPNGKKADAMTIERRKSSAPKFAANDVKGIELNKSDTQIKSEIDVSPVEQEKSSMQNKEQSIINYEKTSWQSIVSNEKQLVYFSKCNIWDLTENRNTTNELKNLKQVRKLEPHFPVNYGPSDRVYKNCSEPRGLVFIKNFASFDDDNKYRFRDGSFIDFTNIVCLFDQLGYEIWDKSETGNIKHIKFMEDLHEFSQMDHSKYDSSVIVIMSHGVGNETFVTSDGKKCNLEKVYEKFNSVQCSSLSGKPKLFILEFCRGQSEMKRSVSFTINEDKARQFGAKYYMHKILKNIFKTDPAAEKLHKNELQHLFKQRKSSFAETEELIASSRIKNPREFSPSEDMKKFQHDAAMSSAPVPSHRRSDMYSIFATGAGGLAFRHRNKGSLLIQAMCQVFSQDAHHDDIDDLFKKVSSHMNSQLSKENPAWTSQHQPVEIHMQGFGKKFYFNPYRKKCSRCQNCRC